MKFSIAAAALGIVLTATALVAGGPAADAQPDKTSAKQAHPLYDDGGTLDWRTKWAEAAEIANDRRRLIFVEWGRES